MMKHFTKLRAPLYSINEYPSLDDQEKRFKNLGWYQAHARNLWDLWSDEEYLGEYSRRSLDVVEPFDEWEEFSLFASHYFLLVASSSSSNLRDISFSMDATDLPDRQPVRRRSNFVLEFAPQSQSGNGQQRRHGSLVPDSECSLGHHGGLGRHSRLSSSDLYTSSEEISKPLCSFPPDDIPARMCHTITAINDNDFLLVGGRSSPSAALGDCWLRRAGEWYPTHKLPSARFRHNAVKVVTEGVEKVLLYGGKLSNGNALDSWLLWDEVQGWQEIEMVGDRPSARFGACLERISDTCGIMFGGIGQDGRIQEDFWSWKICQQTHSTGPPSVTVQMSDWTEKMQSAAPLLFKYLNRFGATISPTSWGLIVAGGIIPGQVLLSDKEIILLDQTALLHFAERAEPLGPDVVSAIELRTGVEGQPRPLLTGHVAYRPKPDQLVILGGGAVCFSFGTFLTEGTFLLKCSESISPNTWSVVPESRYTNRNQPQGSSGGLQDIYSETSKGESFLSVPHVRIDTASQFEQVVANGKPVIIEGCDIGPCTSLWTKEYMVKAVGQDRKVRGFFFFFFCVKGNKLI